MMNGERAEQQSEAQDLGVCDLWSQAMAHFRKNEIADTVI